MKRTILAIAVLLLFTACNEDPEHKLTAKQETDEQVFDREKWKTRQGKDYPFREEMLDDLMNNQGLRELKTNEIIELLGEPTRVDSNYFFYKIEQKRLGEWPLHTTTMVIQTAEDSTVNWVKVHK